MAATLETTRGMLTVQNAAREMNAHPATIRALIHTGALPAINIASGAKCKKYRIRRHDFENFLKSRRSQRQTASSK